MPEYQNPNQDPGMERRLLIVFALTFLVIIAFQPLLKKYFPQTATPPAQTQQVQNQNQAQSSNQPIATSNIAAAQTRSGVPASGTSKQANAESETIVENDFYRITFTNRGAQVKSWILKKFDDDKGQPLDLVNHPATEKYGYPLSLFTYDETLRNKLNSLLYANSTPGTLKALPGDLTFEYSDQDITVRKSFHFDQTYVIQVVTSVVSKGSQVEALPMWPAGFGDQISSAFYASGKIEYQYNDNIERLAIKKITGGATLQGPFHWIGLTDQYFAAVFIPQDPQNAVAVTLHNAIEIPKDPQKPNSQDTVKADVLGVAVGNPKGPSEERMYVGPKSLQVVESVPVPGIRNADPDLRSLVNFGFFHIIARPLFVWLKWTYDHVVHNWGWAIAIQTLIINIALLPLRISSMKSALKMQKVQPQMNSIKDKYKKYTMRDPRKAEMNQEIAALMKREGVSPAGGCLPLLIQMPFLFAYYGMLGAALDLRHARWLWIGDLSSRDPYFILPIAVIITMLFTQRMTPQAGMDPQQQKMMNLMMPVMMGFMSFNLAAGLCLYWSEGSLIGIVQQYVMNKTKLGREMREMALKRARKKEK
ncbi:MAG TPA: membrane protein insertase YidC [Terriglobales bacterium]|nr:membrane protein insertase YidC [Terriglobales bacterium]